MQSIELQNILFVDIETVPQYASFEQMPDIWQKLWTKKSQVLGFENPAESYPRAGIYSEFGKIVCIGFGYIRKNEEKEFVLHIKSIHGKDEKAVLHKFNLLLNKYYNEYGSYLCGHNGKEFDFPYIARRSIINEVELSDILNVQGAKPYETKFLDTLQMWKFGDYKNFTSLELLCTALGVPSPKNDIDGSDVWRVYWQDDDLERIVNYCKQDVAALTNVFLRMIGKKMIENIMIE